MNIFRIKRTIAFILAGIFPLGVYVALLFFYNLLYAIIGSVLCLLVFVLLGGWLVKNPFTQLLEGDGILVFPVDSTGIISPFIMRVDNNYLRGRSGGEEINEVFDRDAVFMFAEPKKVLKPVIRTPDGGLNIYLSNEDLNKARFAMFHYPVILYNMQLRTVVTKDTFSTLEKDSFAEHGVLYLNRKMEELTSLTRDFGRYVVESIKPKSSWWNSPIMIWVLVGGLILLAALFLPEIIANFKNAPVFGDASQASAEVITNRG